MDKPIAYEDARARVEASVRVAEECHGKTGFMPPATVSARDLRALLSGPTDPTEPTEEEVVATIFMQHEDYRSPLANAKKAAPFVQALFRRHRNG